MTASSLAPVRRAPVSAGARLGVVGVAVLGLAILAVLCGVHITQGTADVGFFDLVGILTGSGTDQQSAVLLASRMPRVLAGLAVGVALGAAGAALQSATRNILAAPDTLAVDAGAYAAVVAVAAFGLSLPGLLSGGVAFGGGLAAAAVVLALGGVRGASSSVRLVLAGSAIALGLASVTQAMLLLYSERLEGVYAWGGGTIALGSTEQLQLYAPVVVVGLLGLLLVGRRLDLLSLGDDESQLAGVDPRATRAAAVVLAVLLCAASVSIAGPIGFVGLCAPAAVRLLSRKVRGLARHRALVPMASLAGAIVVIGADVVVRGVIGAQAAVQVPTGAVTTIVGAVFLIVLAARAASRSATITEGLAHVRSRARFVTVLVVGIALLLAAVVGGMLLGDVRLLLGDVLNWLTDSAGRVVTTVLDTRTPRVLAALLAGAALALAGTIVQAIARNPLADPSLIGVSGGAGVGAVLVVTTVPMTSSWQIGVAALAGAAVAAALVFGLAGRGGLSQQRLVLVGIGVSAASAAFVTILLTATDPFNQTKALTWLAGSTYGRSFTTLVPVVIALVIAVVWLSRGSRRLDLLALDDDTPRVLGVALGAERLRALVVAVLLTAAAVSTVGVVAFVGLVAPHAARALVGARHRRVVPVAAVLGALLVTVADMLGRTLIAPTQLPAGVMTALIGAPYFVYLLWQSGRRR